ncbi:multidrug effflux MFS transporter [Lutibaculum baratangense]|uniref:Bcr/CflA family efflux transporter n=1 Tax=Lutibaculum baratangense AMV1 TaxID=631454 RepID=V4RHN2_9HYPH|nr:multidrug effflux MFS transporter [Lutibaculum baratangense]ESR25636.1 Multidrug resistance transporter, Bcr/CflA family [Lutibaculum baratangense AMV1]
MTPVMSEFRMALIGALMVALGPLSMALYTPALPTLVHAYGAEPGAVKLTLTVYFAGFALAQLLCGPLSDAYGRRRVALAFFGIYLVGSAIATVSPSIEWLLVARTVQGIGAAAGIAISRAMVRDQFVGQASARILNLIGIMLGIAPALAPTIGGTILSLAGWHAIFVVMLAYGAVAVALVSWMPETLKSPDPAMAHPVRLVRNYGRLMASPGFMRPALVVGATLGGVYTLASILPFVMIDEIGLAPAVFGMTMMLQTGFYIAGAVATQRLLKRHDAAALVPVGLALVAVSACLMLVVLRLVEPGVVAVMGPVAIWAFGIGMIMPGATTAAMAGFPAIAGAASALMGFFQIGGGLLGSMVSSLFTDPVAALTTILPGMALLAVVAHLGLAAAKRREERLDPTAYELMGGTDPAGYVGPPAKRLVGGLREARDEMRDAAE